MIRYISIIFFILYPSIALGLWPGDCTTVLRESYTEVYDSTPSNEYSEVSIEANGSFTRGPDTDLVPNQALIKHVSYYFEGGSWHAQTSLTWRYGSLNPENFEYVNTLPTGCPTCAEEKAILAEECGGEENITNWNETECTGECASCQDKLDSLIEKCNSHEFTLFNINWDSGTCTGSCKCSEESYQYETTRCETLGGTVEPMNDISCTSECADDECKMATEAKQECPPFKVLSLDYENCTYDCADCTYLDSQCRSACLVNGQSHNFECLDESQEFVSICTCGEAGNCDDAYNLCSSTCTYVSHFYCNPDLLPAFECECGDSQDNDDKTEPPAPNNPDNDNYPDSEPTDNPNDNDVNNGDGEGDQDNDAPWLKTIKKNLDDIKEQNDDSIDISEDQLDEQKDISWNTEKIVLNQGVIHREMEHQTIQNMQQTNLLDTISTQTIDLNIKANTINSSIQTVSTRLTASNTYLSDLNTKTSTTNTHLSDIKGLLNKDNDGYTLDTGEYEVDNDNNNYDATFDPVEYQIDNDSLTSAMTDYIASGIPIISFIQGSGLDLSGATSSLSFDLYGKTITFDFAPYESVLNTIGIFLSFMSVISAFMIIIKK